MTETTDKSNCPVCGKLINDREHSRMGIRNSPSGEIEYWACFQGRDVFSRQTCREDELECPQRAGK